MTPPPPNSAPSPCGSSRRNTRSASSVLPERLSRRRLRRMTRPFAAWLRATLLFVCALVDAGAVVGTRDDHGRDDAARKPLTANSSGAGPRRTTSRRARSPMNCSRSGRKAAWRSRTPCDCPGRGPRRARWRSKASGKRTRPCIMRVFWLDGQERVYTLTKSQPTVQLLRHVRRQTRPQ